MTLDMEYSIRHKSLIYLYIKINMIAVLNV